MENNQKIIKKIRGLLAISKDTANDNECQSAFLLAQKLMIQYQIDKQLIEDLLSQEEAVTENDVTMYKKLHRWECSLSAIVADNFRVKSHITVLGLKRKICFYGLPADLELAKEVYLFAYESILYFSKRFAEEKVTESLTRQGSWDRRRKLSRRAFGEKMKKVYILGFLTGLNQKFSEQKSSLPNEVMILTKIPQIVEKSYKAYSENFKVYTSSVKEEPLTKEELQAYIKGFKQGKISDFIYARLESS
jgi:hypothetical protein